MHGRLALLTFLAAVALTTPASAQLRALAPADDAAGGPVLLGDRVLWGTASGGAFHVVSAPGAGGPATPFGQLPLSRGDAVALAAGPGLVAVELRDPRALSARGRLFGAGADGAFRPLSTDVGDAPIAPYASGLQVTGEGVLTLEDGTGAYLHPLAGGRREVALPPGADPEHVAVAGELGVAPTPEGALVVFDLHNDSEVREISLGRYDAATINGLAISPAGDVAATVPAGDGDDVLLWAPAGASRVRVLRTGRQYSRVAIAGTRVAFAGGDGLREGVRAFVVDAATRRTVFRGPPASDLSALQFDGSTVAFATADCLLAGPAVSRFTLPAGPCVRTDVTVAEVRGGLEIGCINAPERRCRVTVGRRHARVPRGSARVLKVAGRGRVTVRVTDPGGRTRTVSSG